MIMRNRWLIWLVAASLVSSFFASLPAVVRAPSAVAVGGYDNASTADTALRYAGRWGAAACVDAGRSGATGGTPLGDGYNDDGQCKAFVNCIVWMASGHTQWPAGGYSSAFLAAGAQEVSMGAATKGDIIQWDPVGDKLHTAIVVENRGGSTFRVVDSNWGYTRKVTDHVMNVNMAGYAAPRFFRMGTVRSGPVSDGTFVSHGGHVYRIAGGAPIWVSDWSRVGGPQPTRALSDAEFASLRNQPVDGTFISSPPPPAGRGEVYRVAGGAPIYVTFNWWKTMNPAPPVIQVDQYAIDAAGQSGLLSHLNFRPADGTFISSPPPPAGRGEVYRVAGGAPTYVSFNWWKTMNPSPPVTTVSQEAIDQAGQSGAWSHLSHKPADGTFISSPGAPAGRGEVYRVAGGAPTYVTFNWWKTMNPSPPVTTVSQEAIDQAGQSGAWSHLSHKPADGTFISSPGAPAGRGEVYRIAGGAPIYVSLAWWKTLNPTPSPIVVSQEAIDKASEPGAWSHMRYYPADGTLVSANGDSYEIKAAVPTRVTPPKGGLPIDPAAITNAGKPGAWSHLKAPATTPVTPGANPSNPTVAPRRKISGVRATLRSKHKVLLRWKRVDGATRYGVTLRHGHHRLGTSTARPRIVLRVKPGVRYTAIISVARGAADVDAARYRFRVKRK